MSAVQGRLVVGLVRGVHGLRGGVRVEVLTDDPERFEPGSVLHPEGSARTLTVAWKQEDGPGLLVRFEEVTTRSSAERLRYRYLEARTSDAELPPGEFYWHELMDVPVSTIEGEPLGTVQDIFRAGGGEVFVVRGGPRGEVLVPAVQAVIRELAPRDGRIVVDAEALGLDEGPPARKPRGRRTTRALKAAGTATGRGTATGQDADAADPADRASGEPAEAMLEDLPS
jgi:16S rRNA processing protein RimM